MGPHPATRDFSRKYVSYPFLGDKLGPPNLSNAQTPPGNDLVDIMHFPPALHQANRLCAIFFSVLHQPRMLGEIGLILKPINSWFSSAMAFHTLYLLCSYIVPFIFLHCIFL